MGEKEQKILDENLGDECFEATEQEKRRDKSAREKVRISHLDRVGK